ncbi:glycoside hydrolase family 16 protein [Vibrio sp. ER1A]|uniref:glycoside hydrolase family 16 protein n=1 Tax=Vibrio sp. ER1A TaxID=1517681 RepID=UPI0004DCC8CA|nr:glycoside hydrolase family 16 protein [Vibrio sp. ER1A]KFA96609.1 1,3-beta-glucanase [Vibrio sp. ER1A]
MKTTTTTLAMVCLATSAEAGKAFDDPLISLDTNRWFIADGWENGYPFLNRWQHDHAEFSPQGLALNLSNIIDNHGYPDIVSGEIRTQGFYGNGCFEVEMKPVKAEGVVSAFFLFAGPYDQPEGGNGTHNEIDIEFIGLNTNLVQFNFWSNDDSYEQRNEYIHYLDFDAADEFHKYAIEWNKNTIKWYIDDELVYKVRNTKAQPIPSQTDTKLRAMMNIWATAPELSNWAGLYDQSTGAHHSAHYRNFRFTRSKCNN